jgi:hypothetical protein
MEQARDYRTLQGRQVTFDRRRVRPDEIVLDAKNPRIQYIIGRSPVGLSQEQLEELLWSKDAVKALGNSIKTNGGVLEAIIVQKHDGQLIVREGNCRTVAVRRMARQDPENPAYGTLPAEVYDDTLTNEDLAVLLADMHVAGKIRWDAYEQAKHVWDLYYGYGKTYEWLSDHLRLSKSRITQDLKAYQATKEYLESHPSPVNVEKFSFFQELMRKRGLADQFASDPAFRQRFYMWLDEGRLSDSHQVRHVETFLSKPEAAKALDEIGADAAEAVLIRDDPSLESDLFDAIKRATEKLRSTPVSEVQDLPSNPQKLIMLRNLSRAIEDLATVAGVKL